MKLIPDRRVPMLIRRRQSVWHCLTELPRHRQRLRVFESLMVSGKQSVRVMGEPIGVLRKQCHTIPVEHEVAEDFGCGTTAR